MSSPITNLVVAPLSTTVQLVDPKTGNLTAYGQKAWSAMIQAINAALNILGEFNGVIGPDATVVSHTGTVVDIVSHLTGIGQLDSLTNVVADVNLDHIADTATYAKTTVNDVSGATTAYNSLVASTPASNNALLWNGSAWVPNNVPAGSISGLTLPATTGPTAHQWLHSYNASTGAFTNTQPAFTDISGQITVAQGPAAEYTGTIVTAQLTPTGAQGSMTFTNGILTAQTPAT